MTTDMNLDDAFAPLTDEDRACVQDVAPSDPASDPSPVLPAPASAPRPVFRHARYGEPTRVWRYQDAAGAVSGYTVRFDPPDERKQIMPLTLCRGPRGLFWQWKQFQAPRPLYGLDRLAADPSRPVVVVEGEKCADAGAQVFPSAVVIASPGGARAAQKADWRPLKGRDTLIWPDADEDGATYARDVATLAAKAGASRIRIVDALALSARIPNGGAREPVQKWDVADAIGEGWDPEDLRQAADDTSNVFNPEAAPDQPAYVSFEILQNDAARFALRCGRGSDLARRAVRSLGSDARRRRDQLGADAPMA